MLKEVSKVTFHALCIGARDHVWAVAYNGETLISASRDPEHDTARALLARGIRGRMDVYDERGMRRTSWDIEHAAGRMMVEGERDGFRSVPFKTWQGPVAEWAFFLQGSGDLSASQDRDDRDPGKTEPAVYGEFSPVNGASK